MITHLPPTKQTFEEYADRALNEARATYNQRGQEYADSWDLKSLQTPFMNLVVPWANAVPMDVYHRLMAAASLCDVKLSRIGGGYKADTFLDLINYIAFLKTAIEEAGIK